MKNGYPRTRASIVLCFLFILFFSSIVNRGKKDNRKDFFCTKVNWGLVFFQKLYIIFRGGHGKRLPPLTRWVGGVK